MNCEVFKRNLKCLINQKGISMQQFCDDIGIARPTISRYFSDLRNPSTEIICEIANYFDVSVDWLLGLDTEDVRLKNAEAKEIAEKYILASEDEKKIIQILMKKYDTDKELSDDGKNV